MLKINLKHCKWITFSSLKCSKFCFAPSSRALSFFSCNHIMIHVAKSSHPEVFLGKFILKICSKFTREHPYQYAQSCYYNDIISKAFLILELFENFYFVFDHISNWKLIFALTWEPEALWPLTHLVEYFMGIIMMKEVVTRRCSLQKVFLEISKNSQEHTRTRVSFLMKLKDEACSFIK